jgi:hypothetical protein
MRIQIHKLCQVNKLFKILELKDKKLKVALFRNRVLEGMAKINSYSMRERMNKNIMK